MKDKEKITVTIIDEKELEESYENEKFEEKTILELRTCSITNNLGGTTRINSQKHKDKLLFYSKYDYFIDLPIIVEITSGFFDYETGYRYKGKITDKELLEEFRKFGTTKYTPEHYKNSPIKSMYEKTKKAYKNFDPSIVYFSEFDVERKIDKNEEMEL